MPCSPFCTRAVLEAGEAPLGELLGPLMSMIVLPYLGAQAAERELTGPLPRVPRVPARPQRLAASTRSTV